MQILLLVLITVFSVGSLASESKVLPPNVLKLPPEIETEVATYFERLNRRLDFASEAGSPSIQVVLIKGKSDTIASVNPEAYPNTIFWNANFFLSSPNEDIDLFILAHERTHFDSTNRAKPLGRENTMPILAQLKIVYFATMNGIRKPNNRPRRW